MLTSITPAAPSVALAEALRASSRLRALADQPVSTAQALMEAHRTPRSPELEEALAEALRFGARLRAAGEGRALVEGV